MIVRLPLLSKLENRKMQSEGAENLQQDGELFSTGWWERFAVLWNASEYASSLVGLREMSVEVSDKFVEVPLLWGSKGVAISATQNFATLRLSATLANWESFVRGEFSPIDGVLQGRIRIEGDAARIMGLVGEIEHMCAVARMVPQQLT